MKRRNMLGFTLVELIVSIAVIGILASIVIVSYNGWRKSTIITQLNSDLNGAASAMESARTFNNSYPTSISGLTTFKPSQGVILTGGSSDGGVTYCIDASSSQDATIHYYIDSISGGAGAQSGTCATRLVPILIATATSGSTIDLSWSTVSGATSYTLQIASSSTFADASTIATQSGLTFTSTGLLASTTYYYRVGVTNSPGLWSITKSATTTITAPITPTIVANTASGTTTWQWSAADCPAGTMGRYQYRYTISTGYDSGLVAANNTSIGQNTSGQGNTYTVAVQAQCYNANASSSWSGSGSASYSRPVTAIPTNLIAMTASSSSINVSWNASAGATSYTLQRDINSSFTSATTIATQAGLSFVSSGLSQGTPYYYRVQATDANGTSNWSTTATATTTIDAPAAPTVAANTVTTTTTWSWNAASCSAGTTARYQYDYTISPAGYDSGWAATAGTSVAFTTSSQGQTYTVTVQAQCYNANTISGWSVSGSASYYNLITYILTTIAGSGGSVSSGGTYNTGSTPTITATPNTYYSFSSWSGSTGCSGVASHTITMDGNKTCTANFTPTSISAPATPTVAANTVSSTTTWSWNAVSCPGNTARYQYDYTISPSGYDSGWVATAGTSVAFTTSTEGQTYTVQVQAQCYNAVTTSGWSGAGSANYSRPITQYTLTTIAGTGGTVSSGGTYNTGSTPTITATPNNHYSFSSWSGDTGCSGVASHTITMNSNKTCTANFSLDPNWMVGIAGTALAGKYVRSADLSIQYQYKTTATSVTSPQGATGLDPNYIYNMVLVSPQTNPGVDFSAYPAQNACKAIGGRLPNMPELLAIYANRAIYGTNLGYYWSSTEYSTGIAYGSSGSPSPLNKTQTFAVRCVAE